VLGDGITALGVTRLLGRAGIKCVVVAPSNDIVTRSRWFTPLNDVALQPGPDRLADALNVLPIESGVLIPCSDPWVAAVAALGKGTTDRFPASIPAADVVECLIDKARFAEIVERLAIPHPRTIPVEVLSDADTIDDAHLRTFFLKPRDSYRFSSRLHRKALRIEGRADLAKGLADMAAVGIGAILQEYVPGPATAHYFIDGFIDREGNVSALIARQRLRMDPPDFGNSTVVVSIPLDRVAPARSHIERLLGSIRYRGVFSAEFKRDPQDDVLKLLEVNARPWWYVEFAGLCGVDVCTMAYRDALGIPVGAPPPYVVGKRYVHIEEDLRALRRLRASGTIGFAEWFREAAKALGSNPCWDDPVPQLVTVAQLCRRTAGRWFRRTVGSRSDGSRR
jgi:predicted ATP-grasp superfamily ATP-dependent carboligase